MQSVGVAVKCLKAARRDEETPEGDVGYSIVAEFMLRVIGMAKGMSK